MNVKIAAVLARQAALAQAAQQGGRVPDQLTVTALCRQLGISRQTYYTAAHRMAAEGLAGLLPRSRRPHSSPRRTAPEMEDRIVACRKELDEEGWDNGAISIHSRLTRQGHRPPSVPTINRVLQRRGLIIPQPLKRPRSSWRRFTYAERNGCWQMDAFQWRLADGTVCAVFEALDDCTRVELDTRAAPGETSEAALACFLTAVDCHGVPAKLLSDNGAAFSGRRRGWISRLEREAVALGVKVVTSSPRHPQTCGKNERAHKTCQLWLAHQPLATSLADLQLQLDRYRQLYNTVRPHQALGGRTPAEAAQLAPLALPGPLPTPEPTPPALAQRWVGPNGALTYKNHLIYVGRRYTRRQLTVISTGNHVQVLNGRTLIRELDLDPGRRYQLQPRPSDTKP